MTTKAQEQKVLDQIVKLLETLEPDGYVRTAFRGVIEGAQTNIDNDWSLSLFDSCDAAQHKVAELTALNNTQAESLTQLAEIVREKSQELDTLRWDKNRELNEARRDLKLRFKEGDDICTGFKSIRIINSDGFHFVNVQQANGWIDSYKLDNIDNARIE